MEHKIRLKKQEIRDEKLDVKRVAEGLAENFDQKRKLKRAAKKILTANMLATLTAEEREYLAQQEAEEQLEPEILQEAAKKRRTPLRERRARREAEEAAKAALSSKKGSNQISLEKLEALGIDEVPGSQGQTVVRPSREASDEREGITTL